MSLICLLSTQVSYKPIKSLTFKPNASEQKYEAVIQSLTSQADAQTGRLVVRAKLKSQAAELRPNVLANIFLDNTSSNTALRVHKSAIQNIEGQTSVFVVDAEQKGQVHLKAQPVQLGQASNDAAMGGSDFRPNSRTTLCQSRQLCA